MLRLLTFTDLYPSSAQPRHGVFVEHRLRRLVAAGSVTATVVAPIASRLLGSPTASASAPRRDVRHGLEVMYPRFAVVPKFSNWLNPISMALASLRAIRAQRRRGLEFDVIDAHFFYPAGVAAVLLGLWLRKPVVITARGSDVNLHTRFRVQRAWILWAARRAAALVTVSAALRDVLCALGVPASHITVAPNGVDLETFRMLDRTALRQRFGWSHPTVLSVGNLVEEKGHDLVIEALQGLPEVRLTIIGSGPLEQKLRALAEQTGVADRVAWIPYLDQAQLAQYYAAADATILASSREGMPNVLLESLACGTRVIASDVGGSPEIVRSHVAGVLMKERSAAGVIEGYERLRASDAPAAAVRRFAESFGWDASIGRLHELLERVVGESRGHEQAAERV